MLSQHILAGGFAGLVEVSCTHPLDYMKVSIQQNKKIRIREFYRGIFSRYTSIFPMRAILWGCRKTGKKHLKDKSFLHKSGAIGGVAGFLQTFVDAPLENIKIQKMYYNKVNFTPTYLTRGFMPNMARNMILCSGIIGGRHHIAQMLDRSNNTEIEHTQKDHRTGPMITKGHQDAINMERYDVGVGAQRACLVEGYWG